jgi:Plus-3 domain
MTGVLESKESSALCALHLVSSDGGYVTCRCPGAAVNSPYMLEEKFETNKWLQVIRGNSRQIMPMIWVSNKPITEEVNCMHICSSMLYVPFAAGLHKTRPCIWSNMRASRAWLDGCRSGNLGKSSAAKTTDPSSRGQM